MSTMSERHHDQHLEPDRPFTMDEWVALRHNAAAAWRDFGLTMDYNTVWRIADAVLRYALPDRVPEPTL